MFRKRLNSLKYDGDFSAVLESLLCQAPSYCVFQFSLRVIVSTRPAGPKLLMFSVVAFLCRSSLQEKQEIKTFGIGWVPTFDAS